MYKLNRLLIGVLLLTAITSCNKDKDDAPQPQQVLSEPIIVKNIPADVASLGHYTFFSFKDNDTIPRSDSATTRWDIAFKSTTIIVNSGSSGPGAAGAQIVVGLFDELAEAPANGYNSDNASSFAIPTGTGTGWYNYSGEPNHVITPIPGRVLVVQTSDGKYAKVEILSFYKDAPATPAYQDPTGRWYTFRYIYQPDGSRFF